MGVPFNEEVANIYTTVFDERTKDLRDGAKHYLEGRAEKASLSLYSWVEELLARSYIKGVTDGFAQGVAAEVAAQKEKEENPRVGP